MDANATLRLALTCAAASACAASQASPPLARPPETPAALARPEPDPACHGTVQGLLARNGLESVNVRLSIDAGGRVDVVDVLSPDLTPAARIELQRALGSCIWAPRPADGGAETFTTTWFRERDRRSE